MSNVARHRTFEPTAHDLNGKSLLVTGGTGFFGQAFVKQVLDTCTPRRLIVYSRDEYKQFAMRQQFNEHHYPCLRYFIGDIRDRDRLEMALRGVDTVVHSAALKHVAAAEYNPFECIHTNVIGAENLANAAIRCGVKRVVALSTDKAANPVNLYGASKLASDKIFIAANNLSGADGTRFSVVRYGNVMGSRGSVVPLFRRLIAEGASELPITDPRMTRFWITIEQGVNFVLSSLQLMHGGEIFVPKIPSLKIIDLARAIAPTASLKIIGIMPGEKLHEAMITETDARTTLDIGDRYVIEPPFAFWTRAPLTEAGTRVDEGFAYTSDQNSEWLSAVDLLELTSQPHHHA